MYRIIALVFRDRVKSRFIVNGTPECVIKNHNIKTYRGADALTSY
jgi:hypothetical protein